MKITPIDNNLQITQLEYFNIKDTFFNGQNFRFRDLGQDVCQGVVLNRVLKIRQDEFGITIFDCDESTFESVWKHYLALDENYESIRSVIDTDDAMHAALHYAGGLRILKQDLWEMIVSFLISQNNNIKRIRTIIDALTKRYGSEIRDHNQIYYTFPRPKQLADANEQDLREIGFGYRAPYLIDAIERVQKGYLDLKQLSSMPTEEARNALMQIKGVGGKVADCILLFALSRYESCPHDVWVKRIFCDIYGVENICERTGYAFAKEKWGNFAGIAQQYLFYYQREHAGKTS